jgi:hypothetical protein
MFELRTNAQYKLELLILKVLPSEFLIVQFLNIYFLTSRFEDILAEPNLLSSHILSLNEKK